MSPEDPLIRSQGMEGGLRHEESAESSEGQDHFCRQPIPRG